MHTPAHFMLELVITFIFKILKNSLLWSALVEILDLMNLVPWRFTKNYSQENFGEDLKKNHFFENATIFKLIEEHYLFCTSTNSSKQMLFKNIREPEFLMKDDFRILQRCKEGAISCKKHRNCSNEVHNRFCYVEYLDAPFLLQYKILNPLTLSKLV